MKDLLPSRLELQVLSLLWEHGPLPARTVLEKLPDAKPRAYTTVLSVLQVMEKKGLVRHEAEGNRHLYIAAVKQRSVVGPFLSGVVKTIFGGRASTAMQHLLETTDVSEQELAEMKALLENYNKEGKGK